MAEEGQQRRPYVPPPAPPVPAPAAAEAPEVPAADAAAVLEVAPQQPEPAPAQQPPPAAEQPEQPQQVPAPQEQPPPGAVQRYVRREVAWPCMHPTRSKFSSAALLGSLPVVRHVCQHLRPIHQGMVSNNWIYMLVYVYVMLLYRLAMLVLDFPIGNRQIVREIDRVVCAWMRRFLERNHYLMHALQEREPADEEREPRCVLTERLRDWLDHPHKTPVAMLVRLTLAIGLQAVQYYLLLWSMFLSVITYSIWFTQAALNDDRSMKEVHAVQVPEYFIHQVAAFFLRRPFNFMYFWVYYPFIVHPTECIWEARSFLNYLLCSRAPARGIIVWVRTPRPVLKSMFAMLGWWSDPAQPDDVAEEEEPEPLPAAGPVLRRRPLRQSPPRGQAEQQQQQQRPAAAAPPQQAAEPAPAGRQALAAAAPAPPEDPAAPEAERGQAGRRGNN